MANRLIVSSLLAVALLAAGGCASQKSTAPESNGPSAAPTSVSASSSGATYVPAPVDAIPLQVTYDHRLINAEIKQHFSPDMIKFYEILVEGVIDRDAEIPVPLDLAEAGTDAIVTSYFQNMNPLGYLSGPAYMDVGGTSIMFDYKTTEDDHDFAVQQIAIQTEAIIEQTLTTASTEASALAAIYKYLAANTNYELIGDHVGIYGVLMLNEGLCEGFSHAMTWLSAQAGFDVGHPLYWEPEDPQEEGHSWFAGTIGDEYYHFDPTWENGDNQGEGLDYFAMTDEERFRDGQLSPAKFTYTDDWDIDIREANDDSFAPLRGISTYEIDEQSGTFELTPYEGNPFTFDLSTGTVLGA